MLPQPRSHSGSEAAAHHAGASRPGVSHSDNELCIAIDGVDLPACEGQTVAAALLAAGRRIWRYTSRRGEPRSLFCGMGICFDCVMRIDGRPNVRACQTPVRGGMRVETQQGVGVWEEVP